MICSRKERKVGIFDNNYLFQPLSFDIYFFSFSAFKFGNDLLIVTLSDIMSIYSSYFKFGNDLQIVTLDDIMAYIPRPLNLLTLYESGEISRDWTIRLRTIHPRTIRWRTIRPKWSPKG